MQMKRVASQEPGTGAAAATRRWQWENRGGMGRAPFSQFSPCKVLQQPLPPPHRHSCAQQCQDTSGNPTLPEPRCLRPKRAAWGGAAPAPGRSQRTPFPSGMPFTPGAREAAWHRRCHSRLEVGRAPHAPPEPAPFPAHTSRPLLSPAPPPPIPSLAPPPLHISPAPLHLPQSDLFFSLGNFITRFLA